MSYRENCFEKGSDPLQPYPGLPLAEPTEVSLPGWEVMWREGRTANTQGRREDIWRSSQAEESGDWRLCHLLPGCVYHDSHNAFAEGTH